MSTTAAESAHDHRVLGCAGGFGDVGARARPFTIVSGYRPAFYAEELPMIKGKHFPAASPRQTRKRFSFAPAGREREIWAL